MSAHAQKDVAPLGPEDAPPPARPKTRWEIYGPRRPLRLLMLALGAIVIICGGVIALVPRLGTGARPRGPVRTCAGNLRMIGGLYTSEVMEHGAAAYDGGARMLLEFRRRGFVPSGREHVFICPGDPDVEWEFRPGNPWLNDDVDDVDLLAGRCSYAVRDLVRFPVAPDDDDAWIACDRQGRDGRTLHHPNGLHVLFTDGRVEFLHYLDLGLSADDAIVVGPDSPHPELAKMLFVPVPQAEAEEPR